MSDTVAPVLHSLSLDKTTLNVDSGETTLLVTARFTDDLSGLFDGIYANGWSGAGVSISFVSPSGQLASGLFDVEHPLSGNRLDGIFQARVTLPPSAEAGEWKVWSVNLSDEAGNRNLLTPDNSTLLAGTTFTIANSGSDATAPVLHSLDLDHTTLNVGSGQTTLLVSAHFSDNLSGIFDGIYANGWGGAVVSISFVSPSGQIVGGMFDVEHPVSGGRLDGIFQARVTLPAGAEAGEWKVWSLNLSDEAGNRNLLTPDTSALLAETTFKVANGGADATAPVLHSLSLDRTILTVDTGETTLLVTARFSDNLSGLFDGTYANGSSGAVVSISFVSPSGRIVGGMFDVEHPVSGGRLDGIFQARVTLPAGAEAGEWNIWSLNLSDEAGNRSLLTPSNSTLLAGTTFTVANDATDSAAPKIVQPLADHTLPEDQAWSFQVPATAFTDKDGDVLTYSASLADGSPLPDWLSFNAVTRTFSGIPPLNFNGTTEIQVAASDGSSTASDVFALTVIPVNDAPVASKVIVQHSPEDGFGRQTITAAQLLAGVSDVDSTNLSISSLSLASGGGALLDNHNGTWTYRPDDWYGGQVSFIYTVTDGTASASSTAVINRGPYAGPVTLPSEMEDKTVIIRAAQLLAGAQDIDSPILSLSSLSIASGGGTLVDNRNGTWSYTPAANYNGHVSFSYTVTDGSASATSTASMFLYGYNDPPTVSDVTLPNGSEDVPVTITTAQLLAEAYDVDSTSFSIKELMVSSGGGALVNNQNGTWTYTPKAGYSGPVVFTCIVWDIDRAEAHFTASLNLSAVNDAPILAVPIPDRSITEDTTWSFQVPTGTFADIDDGTTLSYSAMLADGSVLPNWLTFNAATRTFSGTPPLNFNGSLDLKVMASDGTLSAFDTFKLTVTPVNDAPMASNVTLPGALEDMQVTITAAQLLTGAQDVDSIGLSVSSLSIASGGGTLVDHHNGTWTYTPKANFSGPVSFNYTVTDGSLSASSSASLDVAPINDPVFVSPVALPTGREDTAITITSAQLLAGASDVEGTALAVSSLSIASGGGALTDNHDGTWTYVPAANYSGSVSFSYTVTDGAFFASSTASLELDAVNDAPSASPVTLPNGREDTPFTITSAELLAGVSDVDGPGAVISALSLVSGSGTLFDNGNGTWTVVPGQNFNGALQFQFTVTDGAMSSSAAAVTSVLPVNDAPIVTMLSNSIVSEGSPNGSTVGRLSTYDRGCVKTRTGSALPNDLYKFTLLYRGFPGLSKLAGN